MPAQEYIRLLHSRVTQESLWPKKRLSKRVNMACTSGVGSISSQSGSTRRWVISRLTAFVIGGNLNKNADWIGFIRV